MAGSGELWACPQVRLRDAQGNEKLRFWRALDAVVDLCRLMLSPVAARELPPAHFIAAGPQFFNAELLDRVCEAIRWDDVALPLWIIGTTGEEHARQRSWEGVGLDVFELKVGGHPLCTYVPLRCIAAHAIFAADRIRTTALGIANPDLERARQVARAYQCLINLQRAFGHGERDRSQSYTIEEAKTEVARVRADIERAGGGLAAHLLCHVDPGLIHDKTREQDSRHIANTDSQIIRLAPLRFTDATDELANRYDRVVIVEDDAQMRETLARWAIEVLPNVKILRAHVKRSLEARALRDETGEPLIQDDADHARTLFCFDLELGDHQLTCGLAGGLWFLYHASLNYPSASRVVFTGYRSMDQVATISGAAIVALKPLGQDEFFRTIQHALPFSALWVLRKSVKEEWEDVAGKADLSSAPEQFAIIETCLRAQLRRSGIGLTVRDVDSPEQLSDEVLLQADVLVLDLWLSDPKSLTEQSQIGGKETAGTDANGDDAAQKDPMSQDDSASQKTDEGLDVPVEQDDVGLDDLLAIMHRCRALRSDTQLIVLAPGGDRCTGPDGVLRRVGRILRDGDVIAHKPLWICGEHKTSLERRVRDAVKSRPRFDVKYRVFTPLLGLVRPRAERATKHDPAYWAPLAVLLGGQHGFGVWLSQFASLARLSGGWRKELREDLRRRMGTGYEESEWWKRQYSLSDDEDAIPTIVDRLADLMGGQSGPLQGFSTVERWLRYVLDSSDSADGSANDLNTRHQPLTGPLRTLFGGETRYEFGARGGWYDDRGNYIPDVPLVFEFCAKRGVVGREAIREIIVRYLREKGGEQVVLVEETTISGYLQS